MCPYMVVSTQFKNYRSNYSVKLGHLPQRGYKQEKTCLTPLGDPWDFASKVAVPSTTQGKNEHIRQNAPACSAFEGGTCDAKELEGELTGWIFFMVASTSSNGTLSVASLPFAAVRLF